jgi:phage baseplate assembly protein W
MITLLPNITSKNWQLSTAGPGIISEGLQDIRQCLDTILRTTRGSLPLLPEFGSDIYKFIDTPRTTAIPNIIKAIIEGVVWEPRVKLVSIKHTEDVSNVKFFITYQLVDQELIDTLTLFLNGGFLTSDQVNAGFFILEGYFPPNASGRNYTISLVGDGVSVLPAIPIKGFSTIPEMYSWVVANWSQFGKWVLLPTKIVLYMPGDMFSTASLIIGISGTFSFTALFPDLDPGQHYDMLFMPDGVSPSDLFPDNINSIESALVFVRNYWGMYGTWNVEVVTVSASGDLGIDFGSDFSTGGGSQYSLTLITDSVNAALLQINAV